MTNRPSERLRAVLKDVEALEAAAMSELGKDHESVYRYYYGKGALDYRDKIMETIRDMPLHLSVGDVFLILRDLFPDEFPGK